MAVNVVPVGSFELTSSRSTNVTVWALLIVPDVITSNPTTKATLDMIGFTDMRSTPALNFGKALSHIVVNGLLQPHRRGESFVRHSGPNSDCLSSAHLPQQEGSDV